MPGDRVKDRVVNNERIKSGLSPDIQAFNEELFTVFPDLRLTSGRREPSDHFSHHHKGDAEDIGKEHSDMYYYLMNTKEGLQLLNKYDLGVIDETDPKVLEKTGGTAPHFHIGKDSYYSDIAKQRLMNFEKIETLDSYISKGKRPSTDFPKIGQSPSLSSPPQNVPGSVPFRLDTGEVVTLPVSPEFFEKEVQKQEVTQEMIEKSDAMKRIEQEQKKREDFLTSVQGTKYASPKKSSNQMQGEIPDQNIEQPDIQTSLPDLPSLFSIE